MTRALVVAVAVGALVGALPARSFAQANAGRVIQGRVVADDTGDPIPNVKVGFTTAAASRAALTDRDGRFALTVPPGVVRLTVAKTAYARREITLPPGTAATDVRLVRTAVITGHVVDSNGEPAPNVVVRAELRTAGGQTTPLVATSSTDDRGEFRLSGLSPGGVVVSAQTIGPNIQRLYFPGVESPSDAEQFELKAGDEIDRITLVLPASYDAPIFVNGGGFTFIAAQPLRSPAVDDAVGVVRGRVVSTTGGVVAGATVRLTQQVRAGGTSTQSDRNGRFAFAGVVPGAYLLGASKTGFSSDMAPFGQPITVTATGKDAELTLTPWSSVTGRVLDELGEPVQGASAQLLKLQFQDGRRRLVATHTRTTDDRGAFRIFGVAPGQYVLSASVGDVSTAELPGYVRTFYPGVVDAASSPVFTILAGQTQSSGDITLARERTVRVSGIVRDAQGRPRLVGSLTMSPSRSSSSVAASVGARVGDGGAFEFPNVPPGQYVIQAYRGARNRSTEGEFATLVVSVGERDVEGLVLQATAGSAIAGRVTFNGSSPDAAPRRAGIDIEAVPSDPDLAPLNGRAAADIRPDWTFVMSGVSGPRRLEVTRMPPGWAVEAVRVRGIDVTDQPIAFGTAAQSIDDVEVVLTDRVTHVVGSVRRGDGRPAAGATAIVFAPTRDRWYTGSRYMRAATIGADGRFSVEGLPPGYYYVAAVANVPAGGPDSWRDPAFLESLVAPSTSVSVGDGARAEMTLTIVEPR
jgi:protocatechuate 3,4-dioxygenase beta subunit